MSDLPTGTRVRINSSYPCEFGRGAVGTVTPGLYNNSVLVRLDTPTEYAYESLYCSLSELDILEPEEPKPMITADTLNRTAIPTGSRVKVIGLKDPSPFSSYLGKEGWLIRVDDDEEPFLVHFDYRTWEEHASSPNLNYAFATEIALVEEQKSDASDVGALKSSIWDLYTEVANEFDFCEESRKLIERRLSQLGISAPKKRWRISFEVEGDSAHEAEAKVHWTSPSMHELPSFKVEEI